MKEEMIYRLRIKRRSTVALYPTFHVYDAELFYFPTKEAAEEKIRGFGWEPDLYCFIIEACPYGRNVAASAFRRWVYDDDGDFISGTLCSEFSIQEYNEPEELLPGRKPEQCRFKTGDFVEIMSGTLVELGIVLEQPITPEDIVRLGKSYAEKGLPNATALDYEEDAYTILTGMTDLHKYSQYMESHVHAYVTNVLPPSLPIPKELKEQLKRLLITVHDEIEYANFDECRFGPQHTGLEKDIIVRSKMSTSEPVIYYLTPGNGALTITVSKEPKRIRGYMESVTAEEFAKIIEWIKLNNDVLMSNWNEPDSVKLCESIKKI